MNSPRWALDQPARGSGTPTSLTAAPRDPALFNPATPAQPSPGVNPPVSADPIIAAFPRDPAGIERQPVTLSERLSPASPWLQAESGAPPTGRAATAPGWRASYPLGGVFLPPPVVIAPRLAVRLPLC